MTVELSADELLGSTAVVELPERALMKHKRGRRSLSLVQQQNNVAIANAVGPGATANATNISIGNTQNAQFFG
jgi:hypothetical protein